MYSFVIDDKDKTPGLLGVFVAFVAEKLHTRHHTNDVQFELLMTLQALVESQAQAERDIADVSANVVTSICQYIAGALVDDTALQDGLVLKAYGKKNKPLKMFIFIPPCSRGGRVDPRRLMDHNDGEGEGVPQHCVCNGRQGPCVSSEGGGGPLAHVVGEPLAGRIQAPVCLQESRRGDRKWLDQPPPRGLDRVVRRSHQEDPCSFERHRPLCPVGFI